MLWKLLTNCLLTLLQFDDPNANPDTLPSVPPGFVVTEWAREPLVRQPCSLAFDQRGRMFVGMGPQYRNPTPETPGDSVILIEDTDGNGQADHTREFARGLNTIQGLAWRGQDLWIANAPDLTICRDLNGDDVADEYVRLYTDLGNLEHGLHGLNWAPDGRLYMSKGNSKGLTLPDRVAPKAFRELWGVAAPENTPDFPTPQVFTPESYQRNYHDPADDWGREGGILRCDPDGQNLEIVASGFRNPWDIAVDSSFEWLGTDNDQNQGDRVFSPFHGAHFGWNHPWSSHWTDQPHPPTAPVSGPLFEGSGTGVTFCDLPNFPPQYRRVFLVNDWLRKATFLWKPSWHGALMVPENGSWQLFADGNGALYRPTDLEAGPDGALYILGWSRGYGAVWQDEKFVSEGRIFRITWQENENSRTPDTASDISNNASTAELVHELNSILPARRTAAQMLLWKQGPTAAPELHSLLLSGTLSEQQETWSAWTLAKLLPHDPAGDHPFEQLLNHTSTTPNLRRQAIRILADRCLRTNRSALPSIVQKLLHTHEPRERFAAVLAVQQVRDKTALPALLDLLQQEQDSLVFYSAWQSLRRIMPTNELVLLLKHQNSNLRKAAFLALAESNQMQHELAQTIAAHEPVAALWIEKNASGGETAVVRGRPLSPNHSPQTQQPTPAANAIRNLQVRSRRDYRSHPGALHEGALIFSDRPYTFRHIPELLRGADYLQTANDDDGSSGNDWLQFDLLLPATVIIALDERQQNPPRWLQDSFQPLPETITADHWKMRLYRKDFPAGRVVLGGNTDDGHAGGKSHYSVIIQPQLLQNTTPTPTPTQTATIATAQTLLANANPDRGQLLFAHPQGAGCARCHSLNSQTNGFGPALSDIGRRSAAIQILQSILEPSAVITEGFSQHVVQTTSGITHAGILLEESGLALTLGLPTGERLVLRKSEIEDRMSQKISAMPDFKERLNNQDAADLTAFLLTQNAAPTTKTPNITALPDRLKLADRFGEIGEFVFADPVIRRPYFSNLKTVQGIQVTRNHPPIDGTDATDHHEMHPGLWLGFGALAGSDFWRNRGSMQHTAFSNPPVVNDDVISFTTDSLLKNESGQTLARIQNSFKIDLSQGQRRIQWDAELFADLADVAFGDQEEMGFAARVATDITEKAGGTILSSTGRKSAKETWGQAADWCDYSGTIAGKHAGILLMASPQNFRTSWWHNRDYGVFVANAFGRKSMNQGPPSEVIVPKGQSLKLKYAAILHDNPDFDPAKAWTEYSKAHSKQ